MTKVTTDDDKNIYAFTRIRGAFKLFAVFNLSSKTKDVKFLTRNYYGDYTNVFTNETISFREESKLTLKPWEYMVLERK